MEIKMDMEEIVSKSIFVFDFNGTLTVSKTPVEKEMLQLIAKLLKYKRVAIISGRDIKYLHKLFIDLLPNDSKLLSGLMVLPTYGSAFYKFNPSSMQWTEVYSHPLSEAEKKKIIKAIREAIIKAGFYENPIGDVVEDRHTQIAFSVCGHNAPLELKRAWDPDNSKRAIIKSILAPTLSEYEITIGGPTGIDVNRKGITKGFAIRQLAEITGSNLADMIFIGDALFEHGNDYPIKETGVLCVEVKDPSHTKKWLDEVVNALEAKYASDGNTPSAKRR